MKIIIIIIAILIVVTLFCIFLSCHNVPLGCNVGILICRLCQHLNLLHFREWFFLSSRLAVPSISPIGHRETRPKLWQ